jgi:hypothetical protein
MQGAEMAGHWLVDLRCPPGSLDAAVETIALASRHLSNKHYHRVYCLNYHCLYTLRVRAFS